MSETTQNIADMHKEQNEWQSEQSMWKQDLVSWRKQISAAFTELDHLRQILETQHRALAEHEAMINAQQQALLAHEQDMAASEHAGVAWLESLNQKHDGLSERMAEQRASHEKIKHYHHELMARLAAVETTINQLAAE